MNKTYTPVLQMGIEYPYRAVICGEEHIVHGWRGENLLTDKGEFVLRQLYRYAIESARLLEVASLQLNENSEWLINGHNLRLLQERKRGLRLYTLTSGEVLRVHKNAVRAAAWVQVDKAESVTGPLDHVLNFWKTAGKPVKNNPDAILGVLDHLGAGFLDISLFRGWSRPIWLTEFHPVARGKPELAELKFVPTQPANAAIENVKPVEQKAAEVHWPKPVARFGSDFSIAIIPGFDGNEIAVTIEPELQALVKRIVDAGGNLPRTRLRDGKPDTYQPEKLLVSKIAKQLIKAKLLGKHKSGRTSVFWAKQRAG